ncbi:MAG: amino acid adenylation domain-containing protein [Legionella sp.]|uniref:amino acid adenylation domain-containing protein n=1 Tax=Legionella sp. TaxID=459 RepID=UPI0039E5ADC5
MIHIASTYIADVLSSNLNIILQKFCDQQVCFHYNQIFQQALLPNSEFNENKNGLNVLLIRSVDLFSQKKEKNQILNDLIAALNRLQKTMHVPLLILLTPTQTATIEEEKYYSTLENKLKSTIEPNVNTTLVSAKELQALSKTFLIFNNLTEKYGHIPYTIDFYDSLALLIARKYALYTRKPYKVIVLDCDETLWRGVIEEDGINGLVINDECLSLQHFMIDLFQAGFLLCLCSKNSEKSVLNVFKKRKEMALNLDKHICSYRINWQPKSANIQSLAEELDLGLDSFIFIDDNNIECAEVKAAFPEVFVIHLPVLKSKKEELTSKLDYLKNIWAFDLKGKSSEDEKRTIFYQQNRLRHALKSESTSYKEFLKNLKIKTNIREANPKDIDRIIQLSQRTNQFNLFPNALSDSEFNQRIVQQQLPGCLVIEVSDRYGDYGLVGVAVYDITNDELLVRSLFLSCRILGREVEYTVINYLAKIAEKYNKKAIKLLFKITDRNIPGIAFLQHLAADKELKTVDHIVLLLSDLKKINPKIIYSSKTNKKITNQKINTSNDYMLDIAKNYTQHQHVNKKYNPINHNKLITVEISLLELLKKYKLLTNKKKDIPFVDLGIDSLTCVLITGAIYQQFSVEIAPFELLKPDFTLHKLTQYLLNQIKTNNQAKSEMVKTWMYDGRLSFTQEHLWEEEQIFPGTSRNNMFSAYQVEGDIDVDILENTFVQLMTRHDSLRFSFLKHNEEPLLKLNELSSMHFKINSFFSDNDEEIKQYVTQFRREPFNLSQAPLFRVSVIKRGEKKTILLFCIHHIIHDGWSLNILIDELSAIYTAYSKQIPLSGISESSSYIHFIQWQQSHISKELLETQRTFWKKQLAHIPKLDLIYDKIRKEEYEKPLNYRISFKINSQTTHKLKQISVINHVTLYDILISAFGLFLSHYTNQNDINFITAVSGRHHPHTANIIGLFTSLVLIRMSIDNQEPFSDLIKKNKKIIDRILNNQDLPFNEIIQLTGEGVNSKIHAFNQAGFIFQSYPINNLIINDKVCKRVFADDKAELIYDVCDECRFGNLVCFMQEYKSELHGIFEYNTILFDKKSIRYMIDSFKTLLKHISEVQNGPARSIPLISVNQYTLLFYKWNQPKVSYSSDVSLLHYFSEQVIAQENALAVIHNESHLTYGELDKISNQLARKLRKEGINREIPVGIFVEKNATRIVAMLSILKAGGCYVPLEMDLPIYRMNNIINDARILFIITDSETGLHMINEHYPEIKSILVTDNNIQSESNAPLSDTTNSNQLAYIMYTSGSTGNPKGIAIEQSGILRLVKSSNYIEINSSDCIAQTSNFLFDAATFEIWGALLNGATLVLIDKNILLDVTSLNAAIKDKKISILFLTTQLFHAYAYIAPYLFQNLNYVIVGGAPVAYEAVKRILNQKNKPACFINGYGPTENTTFSTTYTIKNHGNLFNPIPIGKPITGTQVYVLDHALNPKPIGAPGKLYVGGAGLARGYINQEKLNQEKYIYHLNERLYDTGDIVAWKADGNLKYLGRKDNQIKINGYLVELDEIEVQLEAHHLVIQAIVLVKNEHYHRQLVAYVLLKPGNDLHDLNLYHYLKTILPQYMLPKFYYQIDEVPLTAQGKVDKKALLKKEFSAISYTEYAPPTNIIHEKLICIYSELLNISPTDIGINTEFFDLGGNSISALHLIDKINQQFNIKINFADIYEYANVKSLSEKITALLNNEIRLSGIDYTKFNDNTLKIVKVGEPQKTPIVFIHPIGGTGFCYLDLIKLLPDDQPCYIIQDPSIDANQIVFEDISTMAAYYNQLLLKNLKATKFILAGYSFGGMLSLEMASQLEHQKLGETIRLVIAFDTWVISNFLNAKAKEALRRSIMKQYKRVENELVKAHIDPKPWMELHYRRLQNLGFAYKPPIINKKIILFKANQQLDEFSAMNDSTNYLKAHTSQDVYVYSVSGNHDSILQYPHVKDIGHLLSQYLKDNIF